MEGGQGLLYWVGKVKGGEGKVKLKRKGEKES